MNLFSIKAFSLLLFEKVTKTWKPSEWFPDLLTVQKGNLSPSKNFPSVMCRKGEIKQADCR